MGLLLECKWQYKGLSVGTAGVPQEPQYKRSRGMTWALQGHK